MNEMVTRHKAGGSTSVFCFVLTQNWGSIKKEKIYFLLHGGRCLSTRNRIVSRRLMKWIVIRTLLSAFKMNNINAWTLKEEVDWVIHWGYSNDKKKKKKQNRKYKQRKIQNVLKTAACRMEKVRKFLHMSMNLEGRRGSEGVLRSLAGCVFLFFLCVPQVEMCLIKQNMQLQGPHISHLSFVQCKLCQSDWSYSGRRNMPQN